MFKRINGHNCLFCFFYQPRNVWFDGTTLAPSEKAFHEKLRVFYHSLVQILRVEVMRRRRQLVQFSKQCLLMIRLVDFQITPLMSLDVVPVKLGSDFYFSSIEPSAAKIVRKATIGTVQ